MKGNNLKESDKLNQLGEKMEAPLETTLQMTVKECSSCKDVRVNENQLESKMVYQVDMITRCDQQNTNNKYTCDFQGLGDS